MKRIILLAGILINIQLFAQNLDWNTVSYTTGSLSTNFGVIGTPPTTVDLNITESIPGLIDAGFPIKYTVAGCGVVCALNTSVSFGATTEFVDFTFTFSPAVTGLNFTIFDIDGNSGIGGDEAVVTASGPSGAENITMTGPDFPTGPTITGSGTTTATATGEEGNSSDERAVVSITGGVTTLVIRYQLNPAGPAGGRSFRIGNMDWSGVLPVKITSFSGQKTATGAIQLKWTSENELNLDKYEIERSTDGQNFSTVGFVTALNRASEYQFTDNTSATGTLFYRIKQKDIDGRFQYSTTIALRFKNGDKSGITLFPNPSTSNYIFITTNNNQLIRNIQVFDLNGRTVFQKQGTENRIDISALSKGLYRVKVVDNSGEIFTESFIKQ